MMIRLLMRNRFLSINNPLKAEEGVRGALRRRHLKISKEKSMAFLSVIIGTGGA